MVALIGARAATCLHAGGDGVRSKGAERAVARVLEVDDVGAGAERQFGLGGIAHAGKEQGHGIDTRVAHRRD